MKEIAFERQRRHPENVQLFDRHRKLGKSFFVCFILWVVVEDHSRVRLGRLP